MIEGMKNLLLLLTFLVIAGCATGPVRYKDASPIPDDNLLEGYSKYAQQQEGSVRVIVVRDWEFLGGGYAIKLRINGVSVAKFWSSQRLELFLMPGGYVFRLETPTLDLAGTNEEEFQIKSGASYIFRIEPKWLSGYSLQESSLPKSK